MDAAPPALTDDPTQTAGAYARHLLASLGVAPAQLPALPAIHPAQRAAQCGLMNLTGPVGSSGWVCPVPLAAVADGALAALASLSPPGALGDLRGAELLTERARLVGLTRAGPVSAGGHCRLLVARDGRLALHLAREDDWALLPAWLQQPVSPDWPAVAAAVHGQSVAALVEQGRLLGLAVAAESPVGRTAPEWFRTRHVHRAAPRRRGPRVVDLSALWAGPLCSHLLHRLGAEVIKVESVRRPDGARRGPTGFFDLLNAGKRGVALDPTTPLGREQLAALLASADIVIEASRPRALRQLGLVAEWFLQQRPGLHWISLTGYGRDAPADQWVAYGDDAGVAAGLSQVMRQATGQSVFVGDAIADPLTGIHAALLAWARWQQGQGGLSALALVEVVRHALLFEGPQTARARQRRYQDWTRMLEAQGMAPGLPPPRAAAGTAPALGADTAAVLHALGLPC